MERESNDFEQRGERVMVSKRERDMEMRVWCLESKKRCNLMDNTI